MPHTANGILENADYFCRPPENICNNAVVDILAVNRNSGVCRHGKIEFFLRKLYEAERRVVFSNDRSILHVM